MPQIKAGPNGRAGRLVVSSHVCGWSRRIMWPGGTPSPGTSGPHKTDNKKSFLRHGTALSFCLRTKKDATVQQWAIKVNNSEKNQRHAVSMFVVVLVFTSSFIWVCPSCLPEWLLEKHLSCILIGAFWIHDAVTQSDDINNHFRAIHSSQAARGLFQAPNPPAK